MEILQRLNEGYIRSVQACDVKWFEEHLAEDFLNSNPDGSLIDRATFLAQIARPAGICSFTKADGGAGSGRYTDVWARRQGRWLCVAAHVTRN